MGKISGSFSLVISGVSLQLIIDSEAKKGHKLQTYIKSLLVKAQSVVMYRSTPNQKAQVVNMIRNNLKGKITLAVGDGANDINMI